MSKKTITLADAGTQTEARALWLAATREEICNDGDAISVIATALAAKDAELAEVHQQYVDANEARIDAESQFAETRKALDENDRLLAAIDIDGGTEHDCLILETLVSEAIARRALTGGQEDG